MIKGVIIDWNGVCTSEPWRNIVLRDIEAKTGIPAGDVELCYKKFIQDYFIDKITGKQFIKKLIKELGRDDYKDFNYLINKQADVSWDVLNLILGLKESGYVTAVFSDSFNEAYENYNKEIGGMDKYFGTNIFLSHQEKTHKNDERFYKKMVDVLGLPTEQLVFIDDWPENFDSAKKLGIDCIKFKNYEDLLQELKTRGVNIIIPKEL